MRLLPALFIACLLTAMALPVEADNALTPEQLTILQEYTPGGLIVHPIWLVDGVVTISPTASGFGLSTTIEIAVLTPTTGNVNMLGSLDAIQASSEFDMLYIPLTPATMDSAELNLPVEEEPGQPQLVRFDPDLQGVSKGMRLFVPVLDSLVDEGAHLWPIAFVDSEPVLPLVLMPQGFLHNDHADDNPWGLTVDIFVPIGYETV